MKNNIIKMTVLAIAFAVFSICSSIGKVEAASSTGGGYSVPATIVVKAGETFEIPLSEPYGFYTNMSVSRNDNYFQLVRYAAGSYWGKPATIRLKALTPGVSTVTVGVQKYTLQGDPDSHVGTYRLPCAVTVVSAATSSSPQTTPTTQASTQPLKIPLQRITLNRSSMTLTVGDATFLSVGYVPTNATEIWGTTWSSSDTSVVTINNGIVVAKKAGTATLTAKSGGKTATCKVAVKAKTKPTGSYVKVSSCYTKLNKYRTAAGRKKLTRNTKLEKYAKTRAKELVKKFSHTRPNGKKGWDIIKGKTYRGENIAYGYSSCASVMEAWYHSSGHRAAMLNKKYKKVGIAGYKYDGVIYWVMLFSN